MNRILVLYYSQSGDVARAAAALVAPLERQGAEVVWKQIEPETPYPYPWGTFQRFFDVFPECVVGDPPPIKPLELAADERFDLIVLAWQVWFLSPSLPVQGFFRSPASRVLKDASVVTLSVSRNMRHVAALKMRKLLAAAGAVHLGEAAVTHQGPPLATFVTTPRALLTGRRDRLWGVLPPAGVAGQALNSLHEVGEMIAKRLPSDARSLQRWLASRRENASNAKYLAAELAGWPMFVLWAHVVRLLGRGGPAWRAVGVYLSGLMLVLGLLVCIPLGLALSPFVLAANYWGRKKTWSAKFAPSV